MTGTPVERPDDVTPKWLEDVLGCGRIAAIAAERIGTGQMSENPSGYARASEYARSTTSSLTERH